VKLLFLGRLQFAIQMFQETFKKYILFKKKKNNDVHNDVKK